VLEAVTDPDVPPLPPHITLEQAQAFASTLIKGDPSEWRVIKETAKELAADLMPSRS
jgi:pyruvate dehydrogenase (quinone)